MLLTKNTVAMISIVSTTALSACGGASSGGEGLPVDPGAFAALDAEAERFVGLLEDTEMTAGSDLPPGMAVYDGIITFGVQAGELPDREVLGVLALDVDFAGNTARGTVSDLVTDQDEVFSGTLAITNGTINRSAAPGQSGATFRADLEGIVGGGGTNAEIDALMAGNFFEDGRLVSGAVGGRIDITDAEGARNIGSISGSFAGER